MSRFDWRMGLPECLLLAGLLLGLFRFRAVPFAIFTTGFAASATQVVILLGFQVLYGSIYHQVGLIVTMFMVGLALGSLIAHRHLDSGGRRALLRIEAALALFAALLPLALRAAAQADSPTAAALAEHALFPLLAMIPGLLVGLQFPLAAKLEFRSPATTASQLYTADYLGACLGAIAVSALLIPLAGVAIVCILTAGLKLLSGAILWRR